MIKERIHLLNTPSWIYTTDLSEIVCTNNSNGLCEELKGIIAEEGPALLSNIGREGVVGFGPEGKFCAWLSPQGVMIQCVAEQDRGKELTIQADISDELNKVLKKEIALHQETQEKLKEHSAKLNAIFNSTALYIWTMKGNGELTSFNKIFAEQMKEWFDREMAVGGALVEDPIEENMQSWLHFQEEMSSCLEGNKKHFQVELKTLDGTVVWVELYMDPIIDTDTEEIIEVSCIGLEISDRVELAAEMSQSLQEKETLLQEVHHRVKNNLQIISSLLNLQSACVNDDESLAVLKESQNRIKSMSFIHESLYMSNNFSSVDIREYVKGLSSNLLQSYCLDPSKVDVVMDIDQLTLNIDQAIPCGLIINELVSNTFKHAFPDGASGELRIRIKEKEGRMAILVSDNGKGIPKDWNLEESESLGIQLVYTLTEQLDGEIEYSGEKGTKYLITFDRIKNH